MRKLKITSDGTINGTIVTDAESGKHVGGVKKMTITFDTEKEFPTVNVELIKGFTLDAIAVLEDEKR